MANTLKIDAHVKHVEDQVMIQRRENLNQLKAIKSYLTGVKTGTHSLMLSKIKQRTQSSSSLAKGFLFAWSDT